MIGLRPTEQLGFLSLVIDHHPEQFPRQLGHVHAVDNNRGVPGDGHLDFVSIIAALRDVGYSGYLSLETQPESAPFDTARRGITVLRKIVNSLNAGT